MELDATDGPVVLNEAVEDGAHAVEPHLGDAAVEARQGSMDGASGRRGP